jgi:hypothetical protein
MGISWTNHLALERRLALMTTPRVTKGSDVGAPEINDLVDDLAPEEFCDPLAEEAQNE